MTYGKQAPTWLSFPGRCDEICRVDLEDGMCHKTKRVIAPLTWLPLLSLLIYLFPTLLLFLGKKDIMYAENYCLSYWSIWNLIVTLNPSYAIKQTFKSIRSDVVCFSLSSSKSSIFECAMQERQLLLLGDVIVSLYLYTPC